MSPLKSPLTRPWAFQSIANPSPIYSFKMVSGYSLPIWKIAIGALSILQAKKLASSSLYRALLISHSWLNLKIFFILDGAGEVSGPSSIFLRWGNSTWINKCLPLRRKDVLPVKFLMNESRKWSDTWLCLWNPTWRVAIGRSGRAIWVFESLVCRTGSRCFASRSYAFIMDSNRLLSFQLAPYYKN